MLRLGCSPCWRVATRVRNCDNSALSSSLAALLSRIRIKLGKYQQTLRINFNSIHHKSRRWRPSGSCISPQHWFRHSTASWPMWQIIRILSGKSVPLIKNLTQILDFSAADLEKGIKHSVVGKQLVGCSNRLSKLRCVSFLEWTEEPRWVKVSLSRNSSTHTLEN